MSARLIQAWEAVVRRRGRDRAVAQAADGRLATFAELDAGAARWAREHRPEAGRAVVFAVPNGIAWLEIFIALLRAGAVAVPVDPAEPVAAQERVGSALRAGCRWDGARLVPRADARRFRDPAPCLAKVTSGSTGTPRALLFTAGQLLADARQIMATMRFGPRDVNYALIPFGHSYGLGNMVIPLLARGVPVVCGSAALPHAVAADFARWRPTVFPGVPVVWRALVEAGAALPGLRLGISAGAPLAPEVAAAFAQRFGRRLHGFYGSSETGGITYDRTGAATLRGGVGPALRGVTVRGRRGRRLWVASAAVTTHGNRRRFGRHGAWVMPDRAEIDGRGGVTLLGRRGAMVKIGGRRVNLAEVAALIRRLDGVRDVWAEAGGADPCLGAAVATDRSAAALRAELQEIAPPWKIPKRLVTLAVLPVTARGKPDAAALRAAVFGAGPRR